MIIPVLEGLTLTKGHAAGCDLIIFPDVDGVRTVSDADVERLCDRATGIGASGVLRAVRASAVGAEGGEWYADLRSSRRLLPGDLALYAHYLRLSGLIDLAMGDSVDIVTPAGVVTVSRDELGYTVPVEAIIRGGDKARGEGFDRAVSVTGLEGMRGGLTIDSPSAYVVAAIGHRSEFDSVELARATYDPPMMADLVLVMPEGEELLEVGGSTIPATDFVMASRGDQIESAVAASVALDAWAGSAGAGVYRTGEIITRVGTRQAVTVPAEIIGEFQLAGLVGEF